MKRLEDYDVFALPCGRIYYDADFNCRGDFTLQSVSDLADSIKSNGRLLTPVWVQPAVDVPGLPEGYDWRLIAGHRRYKAHTVYLKWPEIAATVLNGLDERQAHLLNFTENLERKDLNPLEEAMAISTLYPDGVTLRQAADELKRDTKWVHARLRLLKVPEPVQQLVAARRLTLLDLEIVCRKETPEAQIDAANALAASKRGRGRKAVFTGEKLLRSFRRRRNKEEINGKIAAMLNIGISGLVTRFAAWCVGAISDDELDADITRESENQNPPETC